MRLLLWHWALGVIMPFGTLWLAAALNLSTAQQGPASDMEIAARLFQNAAPAVMAIGLASAAAMTLVPRLWNPPALVWAALGFAAFVLCCLLWQALFGSVTGTFLRHDMTFLLKPAAIFAVGSAVVQALFGPKRPSAWD